MISHFSLVNNQEESLIQWGKKALVIWSLIGREISKIWLMIVLKRDNNANYKVQKSNILHALLAGSGRATYEWGDAENFQLHVINLHMLLYFISISTSWIFLYCIWHKDLESCIIDLTCSWYFFYFIIFLSYDTFISFLLFSYL